MAKPSWVSVSPQSSSGNKTVFVGVTANGGTSNRSGTITITGIIGGRTITKTVTITQNWAATIRVLYSFNSQSGSQGYYVQPSTIEDAANISVAPAGAETLQVCYPYLGGSNICHYHCTKDSNGIFHFELNQVHITAEGPTPSSDDVDDDFWDMPNAWFIPIPSSTPVTPEYYTPVLRFTYNPINGAISILDTLYSLGGALFEAEQGGGIIDDPICPSYTKMYYTGMVGAEAQGYGAMKCTYVDQDEEGQVNIVWRFHMWFHKILQLKHDGTVTGIDHRITARCCGRDTAWIPYSRLSVYAWNTFQYIYLDLQGDSIQINENVSPGSNMESFYHPSMLQTYSF